MSEGKPLILGEVGHPPFLDVLESQPKWGLYVVWAGMVRNTLKKQYEALVNDPRVLSMEMITNENWTLQEKGSILTIHQSSSSFWSRHNITMVFGRE
ncbi:MAG: hypothetical protein JXR41_00840 [Bacteroidales bacterium]|nr:hypothetical protein [Bacteroidales bacterium]MBN2761607.1 hypothetical protein [Bacteroidales bacterium]